MEPDPSPRRKMKFVPKAPRRRNPTPAVTTPVRKDADDDQDDIQLLRRLTRRQPAQMEKKALEEVVFSHGVASTDDPNDSSRQMEKKEDEMLQPLTSVSTARTGVGECSSVAATEKKKKKEYREPWDYDNSYYPTTLPLRKPYSGNPDLVNKEEFEQAPKVNEDDDLPAAIELDLVNEDDNPRMLFFKFPSKLPLGRPTRRDTDDQSKGKGNSSVSGPKGKETGVEELPEGYMGKMLVYKSGAVKLMLGDILFDVSAGIECDCPQTAMAINTVDGDCCELGDVTKKAIVMPDFNQLDAFD